MPVRRPVFAEHGWYPLNRAALVQMLEEFVPERDDAAPALAIVAPHAGYVFSGPVAGEAYSRVVVPDDVILLSVNHWTSHAPEFALFDAGTWQTPLGDVPIATELVAAIVAESNIVEVDYRVHMNEHSGELHLPFLQHRNPGVRIAPVCISAWRLPMVRELGAALARAAARVARPVLVVASTDMSHEDARPGVEGERLVEFVKAQDQKAIDKILALDEEGLWDTVQEEHVTMCGYASVTAALVCSKARGATEAVLAAYGTSADSMHGRGHGKVVGYAGIIIR